ncbi:MAG TPA: hypothetical protein VMS08_03820 [Candidatus Saccharimonadia bacterium]|nr:hypothetical protein [Candidatus Saccharimonadia bacterium]
MSNRSLYFLGAGIGGTIGGFVPAIWGGSLLGGWSILLSTVGGLVGIWAAYKFIT